MVIRRVCDLLTEAEFSLIEQANLLPEGRRHPTWFPILMDPPGAVDHLSNKSVSLIANAGGGEWLESIKPRLVRLDDPQEAASALAELRAYGGLIEAGFTVVPIPLSSFSATPDFSVEISGEKFFVEVYAKHEDGAQTEFQRRIGAGENLPGVERHVSTINRRTIATTITILAPGGAPNPNKPNDSIQANLISKICASKGGESQFSDGSSTILWIDFRTFGAWPQLLKIEQATPLISGHHGITSGAFWYAFYGWRGAPIFEEGYGSPTKLFKMGHDGRFRMAGNKKSKLAGVILVLEHNLIFLENPWADYPLSLKARHLFERLPWFDLGHSVCDWSIGDALAAVELGARQIKAMEAWYHSQADEDN